MMEALIHILSVLIVLRTLLALSLFPHIGQRMLFAGIGACWIWIVYPFAIEQGNRFLGELFGSGTDYLNGGGLLILEGMGLLTIRILLLREYFGTLTGWWGRHKQLVPALLFVPGLCFFAVLYYGEMQLFLTVDRLPFEQLTFAYALVVWAAASWLPSLFRYLLPEKGLRIELDCFLLALQIILAMVFTALPSLQAFNSVPDSSEQLSLMALLSWLALLLAGIVLGYMQYGRKIKKKNKF